MNSKWIKTVGQKYLFIEAEDHYDLGFEAGKCLFKEIINMNQILNGMITEFHVDYTQFQNISKQYLTVIPEKYLDELRGMAAGASSQGEIPFTLLDAITQATFIETFCGQMLPKVGKIRDPIGCTDIGTVNKDGSVIIGQNWDFNVAFAKAHAFVHTKIPNEYDSFTYRYGMCPALPVGKNNQGLTITMNLVQTLVQAPIMTPVFVAVREALATTRTADDAMKIIYPNGKIAYSINFLIADNEKIIAIQSLPEEMRYDLPNNVIQSNTYKHSDWQSKLAQPDYSKKRQSYAEDQLKKLLEKDILNDENLLNLLADSPIICRDAGLEPSSTIAFMTKYSFGLGTPKGTRGKNPF